jgi:hypothetical protein
MTAEYNPLPDKNTELHDYLKSLQGEVVVQAGNQRYPLEISQYHIALANAQLKSPQLHVADAIIAMQSFGIYPVVNEPTGSILKQKLTVSESDIDEYILKCDSRNITRNFVYKATETTRFVSPTIFDDPVLRTTVLLTLTSVNSSGDARSSIDVVNILDRHIDIFRMRCGERNFVEPDRLNIFISYARKVGINAPHTSASTVNVEAKRRRIIIPSFFGDGEYSDIAVRSDSTLRTQLHNDLGNVILQMLNECPSLSFRLIVDRLKLFGYDNLKAELILRAIKAESKRFNLPDAEGI